MEEAVARVRAEERRKRRWLTAALGVVLLALAGGGLWVYKGHVAARAEREQRTERIKEKVEALLEEAESRSKLTRWAEAEVTVRQAEALLAEEGPEELRQRVRQRLADLQMLRELEEISLGRAAGAERFDRGAVDEAYARAFREFGLDLESKLPETSK
jgi:erythromycin esterase-like protein